MVLRRKFRMFFIFENFFFIFFVIKVYKNENWVVDNFFDLDFY